MGKVLQACPWLARTSSASTRIAPSSPMLIDGFLGHLGLPHPMGYGSINVVDSEVALQGYDATGGIGSTINRSGISAAIYFNGASRLTGFFTGKIPKSSNLKKSGRSGSHQ